MSLVIHNDFGEYYNGLVTRERTSVDMLKDITRDEVAQRKRVMEEEALAFGDVLHIQGVWIGQKKQKEKGLGPKVDPFEMALFEKQREIWFPAAPPKPVQPPARNARGGFPKKAFRDLCEEETELRNWLHGVERKLREHIEASCQESHYILTCFNQMYATESRARAGIEKLESDKMSAMRKQVFMVAPPDFYRRLALERYPASKAIEAAPRELTVEELEEEARQQLTEEEALGRAAVHEPLVEAIEAQMYIVHHLEICDRLEIEQEFNEGLSACTTELAKESFGTLFYTAPMTVLHAAPPATTRCLTQLLRAHIENMAEDRESFLKAVEEARKEEEENGVEPWELKFPEVAARMYEVAAAAEEARRATLTGSNRPSFALQQPPQSASAPAEAPAPALVKATAPPATKPAAAAPAAPAAPAAAEEPAEEDHSRDLLPPVERAGSRMSKEDDQNARQASNGGSSRGNPMVRFVDDGPNKAKKRRAKKKGSFHAFESGSDSESES